ATARAAWPMVSFPMKPSDWFGATIVPGALAVVTGEEIAVVDLETGKLRWRMANTVDPSYVHLFPGVAVLAERGTGEAIGVDLITGTPKWRFSTPIHDVFGMLAPRDLAQADAGIGVPSMANSSPQMFIADGKGQIAEYSATTGAATGRVWHGVPPNDGY